MYYFDSHVHFRDFEEAYKETIKHGLEVARDSGLVAVGDMPNKFRSVTTEERALECIKIAREADVPEVFYGIYFGATANPEQLKRAVAAYRKIDQILGIKLYAGHSVGKLGVTREEDQLMVYQTLAEEEFNGVLVDHCEKELHLDSTLWNPQQPVSHCFARPEYAEIESVRDQLRLSKQAGFKGKLHVAHISSPAAVDLVVEAKAEGRDISCGICPHHFIYDWSKMSDENGLLWKMNPPLREPQSRDKIFQYLREGKIDWIETDHAPHSLTEKKEHPFMSGIPGLAWWPLFEEYLRQHNFTDKQIERLTFSNALERFGLDLKLNGRMIRDRRSDYPFDPYSKIAAELRW